MHQYLYLFANVLGMHLTLQLNEVYFWKVEYRLTEKHVDWNKNSNLKGSKNMTSMVQQGSPRYRKSHKVQFEMFILIQWMAMSSGWIHIYFVHFRPTKHTFISYIFTPTKCTFISYIFRPTKYTVHDCT